MSTKLTYEESQKWFKDNKENIKKWFHEADKKYLIEEFSPSDFQIFRNTKPVKNKKQIEELKEEHFDNILLAIIFQKKIYYDDIPDYEDQFESFGGINLKGKLLCYEGFYSCFDRLPDFNKDLLFIEILKPTIVGTYDYNEILIETILRWKFNVSDIKVKEVDVNEHK